MKIELVNIEHASHTWPQVKDFINVAIEQQSGEKDCTLDEALGHVSSGHWLLFVARQEDLIVGACLVQVFNRSRARVSFVTYAGGHGLSTPTAFEQLCLILTKKFEVTYIECAANATGARLWGRLGFTEKYRILGAQL